VEVFKRPQFLRDVGEELTWLLEKAGAEVAESWYESVHATITQLGKHPFIGRERKDLSPPGIRSWRVSDFPRWLIFYAVEEEKRIVLHRVRQGTMDLTVLRMKS
jgi:plasmid stabilization system protein ParE